MPNSFKESITTVEKVLTDAELTRDEVDDVVVVGGSAHIPKVCMQRVRAVPSFV